MRLNSLIGTEGSPVSSVNCDRPSHSGIRALECNECWASDNRWLRAMH